MTRRRPSRFVAVARVDEIPVGESIGVRVDGTAIAVFNVDGELRAIHAVCPHRGANLGEGYVEDGVVTCPLHGYRFELATGESVMPPGLRVGCYEVRISGDAVEVEVEG